MSETTNCGISGWIKYIAIIQTIALAFLCWGFIRSELASRTYQSKIDEVNKKMQDAYQKSQDEYKKTLERWNGGIKPDATQF